MAFTYTRPRGERPVTLGQLASPTGAPAVTNPLTPGGRTPAPGFVTDPSMGVGSATNPNLAPGTSQTGTVDPNAPNMTPTDNRIGGGMGGFHRAGWTGGGGQLANFWTPELQSQVNSQVSQAGDLFNSNPAQAAAILGAPGKGVTARDTLFAQQHFGGDMQAYKTWLQGQLQANPDVQFNGTDFGPNTFPGRGGPAAGGVGGTGGTNVGSTMPGTTLGSMAQTGNGSPGYGVNVSDFLDPSMAFRMNEEQRAMENSAAARGSLMSGDTLRALQDRSQALAGTEYGNAWNRAANVRDFTSGLDRYDQGFAYNAQNQDRQFDYNRLRDLAQFGLQASGQEAATQNQLAGILAQILQNGGQIAGTGQIGAGNAVTGGIGNILTWLLQQQAMQGA